MIQARAGAGAVGSGKGVIWEMQFSVCKFPLAQFDG